MEMPQPRIWLVEDEASIAETLIYMLQQDGFAVTSFERGLPVLDAAARQLPDLAILDVGLPDISGFELCRRLLARAPGLPVLFLTARSDEIDKLLGLEMGADDYIAKPFSPRKFVPEYVPCCAASRKPRCNLLLRVGQFELDEEAAIVRWCGDILPLHAMNFCC
jgi:two-component system catabolic regulation response regulator CreB